MSARSRATAFLSSLQRALRWPSLAALGLVGCAGPTGPVVGDWRGVQDTFSISYYAQIELILDGPPGATAGVYHYTRLEQEAQVIPGQRFLEWDDHWVVRPYAINGQPLRLLHLDHIPNGYLPDYIWFPNDLLLPVANPAKPDLSRAAFFYALHPIPRGTFGYGRP